MIRHKIGNRVFYVTYPETFGYGNNLIFWFHPFTWTPDKFRKITNIEPVCLKQNYICVYPVGQFRSWFSAFGHRQVDLDFFRQMVYKLHNDLSNHPKRIVVAGFSDGAYFANWVGSKCPDILDGVISVSGGFKGVSPQTQNRYPVLVLQGSKDKLVNKQISIELATNYRLANHETVYHEVDCGHVWHSEYNFVISEWLDRVVK